MSYQVLARKWRPGNFREMVGQEHVLRALINALDNNRLHHAYLFTGTRGVGKTTIARILAKCLNCEQGVSSEPCGSCASCREIAEGRSVDLLEVDAASRTKVEDTRELLENVQYAPTASRFKIYLIDEVHMLSTHSFNALLKTLEEPPPHVKFLLATTDPQKLPATVLSRCLQFHLKNMPPEQIVDHLAHVMKQEGADAETAALWLLARAAAGSMRDALSLADQGIAYGDGVLREVDVRDMLGCIDRDYCYRLVEGVREGHPGGLLEVVGEMAGQGVDFAGALDEVIALLHRLAVAQAVPESRDDSWGDGERLSALAQTLTAEDVQLYYQVAINGRRDIELAPDLRGGFEMVLLRMVAFRPADAREAALDAGDARPQRDSAGAAAAGEVGDRGKKPAGSPRGSANPATAAGTSGAGPDPQERTTRQPDDTTSSTALQALRPENWANFLAQLGLAGIVHSIASNCWLAGRDGNALHFVLDAEHASLFNDSHAEKLRLALENYLGHPVTVRLEVGVPEGETPAMRRHRLLRERQQEAVAAIEGDPRLQALISRFDGELDRASIAPDEAASEVVR